VSEVRLDVFRDLLLAPSLPLNLERKLGIVESVGFARSFRRNMRRLQTFEVAVSGFEGSPKVMG
jgi:hypothetical protein